MEAADAGIPLIVPITEGIPALDMVKLRKYLDDKRHAAHRPQLPRHHHARRVQDRHHARLHPPPAAERPKNVGIISRSGTLTYEAVWQCTTRGIGQSTCVGIGGDPVKGLNFIELLELFQNDPDTDAIVLIGEIGGTDEEQAAAYIKANVTKPVVAFIAGRTAPPGRRMGHAGAIISGGEGTAESKIAALRAAGITVADSPADIGATVASVLKSINEVGVPLARGHVFRLS